MPPLTIDTSEARDCSRPLLFECAWEVANKGMRHSGPFLPVISPFFPALGLAVTPMLAKLWFLIGCANALWHPWAGRCLRHQRLITSPIASAPQILSLIPSYHWELSFL
jgi:hypothetical protein